MSFLYSNKNNEYFPKKNGDKLYDTNLRSEYETIINNT